MSGSDLREASSDLLHRVCWWPDLPSTHIACILPSPWPLCSGFPALLKCCLPGYSPHFAPNKTELSAFRSCRLFKLTVARSLRERREKGVPAFHTGLPGPSPSSMQGGTDGDTHGALSSLKPLSPENFLFLEHLILFSLSTHHGDNFHFQSHFPRLCPSQSLCSMGSCSVSGLVF